VIVEGLALVDGRQADYHALKISSKWQASTVPHEPKFQILAAIFVALFAGGVALVWPKSRVAGVVTIALSLVGLILMYLYWPEAPAAESSPSTSTQGAELVEAMLEEAGAAKERPVEMGASIFRINTTIMFSPTRPQRLLPQHCQM
jgi:hypothetical protein